MTASFTAQCPFHAGGGARAARSLGVPVGPRRGHPAHQAGSAVAMTATGSAITRQRKKEDVDIPPNLLNFPERPRCRTAL